MQVNDVFHAKWTEQVCQGETKYGSFVIVYS